MSRIDIRMRDVLNGFKIVRVGCTFRRRIFGQGMSGPGARGRLTGAPGPAGRRRTRVARAPHNDRTSFPSDSTLRDTQRTGVAPPFSYYRVLKSYIFKY